MKDNILKKGFTLIELLIVIAIIGTLAVVVLLALNPIQQLARTRDAGRISTVTQLGHAIEAFATVHDGVYPDPGSVPPAPGGCPATGAVGTWVSDCLVDSGEISSAPGGINYSVTGRDPCAAVEIENSVCYVANADFDDAIVYMSAEADTNISRCAAGSGVWFVYDVSESRGGILCTADWSVEPNETTADSAPGFL